MGLLLTVLGVAAVATSTVAPPEFKLYVEESGVYQISWERLHEAGLEAEAVPSAGLAVTNLGQPVPVWVEDGGDGAFGPGDRVEFVADVLRGESSWLDEFSRFNCYRLSFASSDPRRGAVAAPVAAPPGQAPQELIARRHLEEDLVMVRFQESVQEEPERWYWARLSVAQRAPFVVPISVDGVVRDGEYRPSSVHVEVGVRGWSQPRLPAGETLPHHRLEVTVGATVVASSEWNGSGYHQFAFDVPAALVKGSNVKLGFRTPQRVIPASGDPLVDVVLLNWLEVSYPATAATGPGQVERFLPTSEAPLVVRLIKGRPVSVYSREGVRTTVVDPELRRIMVPPSEHAIVVATVLREPAEVVLDHPSDLRSSGRRADYLVITHASLAAGVAPLVELHREAGLEVAVVDVQDIYDEFNHGLLHPRALRDFLSHAYHSWQRPAPRFVLLVGDASWDAKNLSADDSRYADWSYRPGETGTFIKNDSTPYAAGRLPNDRNLVPTWNYPTYEGHAASDNWLACVDGDDDVPDLAVGRFPAADLESLAHMVSKTVRFARAGKVGPWLRNLLFITNESAGFQHSSNTTASKLEKRGYASRKIYPQAAETTNDQNTREIIAAIDSGVRIIQFLGHGGRYIWRTGPPDLKKNHDLFTLDHVDQLAPSDHLPVVASLTCYSAPFDHPTADSIGEKLLRVPDRGAIGVFAASWRNSPTATMGELLIEELSRPGATVGEGIQRMKAQLRSPILNQTYNLLGDPAVVMPVPAGQLEIVAGDRPGAVAVVAPGVDGGRVLVEWVGEDRSVVAVREVELENDRAVVVSDEAAVLTAVGVRGYAWSEATQTDAVGWLDLAPAAATAP